MKKTLQDSFSLEGIFNKKGILLKNNDGNYREVIDILEDMYLRLSPSQLTSLFYEIGEEEEMGNNIFQGARNEN